jgi:hypothetical protein
MKTYRFHWRDGTTCDGDGASPEEALPKLGYGSGAVAALDYHEELSSNVNLEYGWPCYACIFNNRNDDRRPCLNCTDNACGVDAEKSYFEPITDPR